MVEQSGRCEPGGAGREDGVEPAGVPPPAVLDGSAAGVNRLRALRGRVEQFEKSAAGRYWSHLSTADFMNSSCAFAALAVLSAFPFLAVSSAALGGDIRTVVVARMGLSPEATKDIDGLIATGNKAVATLTWISAIVLLAGAIGMASTLQNWYARIFEQPPPKGLLRHFVYQLLGVAAFTIYVSAQIELFHLARPVGGRGLIFLITFVTTTAFWWITAYMALYRQLPLRQMLPAGVATGACLTGLGIVSAFFFSDQVTSGQNTYGPAGVVIALITFLVGYGVCLHAGAVFGRMWNEWRQERASLTTEV
jgi:membrane protein